MKKTLLRTSYIPYFIGAAIIIIYLSYMHNRSVVYTQDNSVPMASFVQAAHWLSTNLHGQEIALVPQPTVFYALEPQLINNLKDYKTIWDSAGVVSRANTTNDEVIKVRQNLIDFIKKNKQVKYLLIDWFYRYSHTIFKDLSCADLANSSLIVQAKSFNFVQPHTGWHSKLVICEPITVINSTNFLSDNFDDNILDNSRWQLNYVGKASTVREVNHRLEIVIPANSFNGTTNSTQILAGLTSVCNLRGDFDFQIDYELLEWPSSNGVYVFLSAHKLDPSSHHPNDNTARASLHGIPKDIYSTDFGDTVYQINATSDKSGKLRIVRSGSVITGYYYSSSSERWVPIHSAEEVPLDINIKVSGWTDHDLFANRQVKIVFDNFVLNRGQLVSCQPQ
jgi:hypothetical protein